MSLRIENGLTGAVQQLTLAFGGDARRQVLEAMCLQLVSIAKRAFSDASLRAAPWAPHKFDYGGHTLLRKSGALWQSIRIESVDSQRGVVGSDRKYAAVQQLGATIVPRTAPFLIFRIGNRVVRARQVTIPPRPFLPFTPGGALIPTAQDKIEKAGTAKAQAIINRISGS